MAKRRVLKFKRCGKPRRAQQAQPIITPEMMAQAIERALSNVMTQKAAPAGGGNPVAYVGCDQRYTKNIGNYESFVYGFSVSFPVSLEAGDDIETISTKEKLRPKYEAAANLISDIMEEVGAEIDKARGAV